jgi:predicted nucleic acid-binding protein
MSSVIIDTGFVYALYCKKDSNHIKAIEAANNYSDMKWLTSCFVFQELFWLLSGSASIHIFEAERTGIFQVVDFERTQLSEIEIPIKKYSDREVDLADASLIFLAEQLGHGNILTTDNDFSIYRWNRTKLFNILM